MRIGKQGSLTRSGWRLAKIGSSNGKPTKVTTFQQTAKALSVWGRRQLFRATLDNFFQTFAFFSYF
jgi:hypothetical protein